jgi:hypothetical protein
LGFGTAAAEIEQAAWEFGGRVVFVDTSRETADEVVAVSTWDGYTAGIFFSTTLPCGDPRVRPQAAVLCGLKGLSTGWYLPVFPVLCHVLSLESKGEFPFARTVGYRV